MNTNGLKLRTRLKYILRAVGLLPVVRRLQVLVTPLSLQERKNQQRFLQFKKQFGAVLQYNLNSAEHKQLKKVLISGAGFVGEPVELSLIKALELADCIPVVLVHRTAKIDLLYYKLAVRQFIFWEDFTGLPDTAAAEAILARCKSVQELKEFIFEDIRVGLYAVSLTLRYHRIGSLDLGEPQQRLMLIEQLASAMLYASAAQSIVRSIRPQMALYMDGVYTPEAEFVDACLANGVDAISWDMAHRSDTLMLKRYKNWNSERDRNSLSQKSWEILRDMPWSDRHREQLQQEIYDSYATGDWYNNSDTQFNKRLLDANTVNRELGLDARKKTAFIFLPILWDATLVGGIDLFRDYEEWLVETVRAACRNDRVKWVIKVHPAHVGKALDDGFHGEPAEVIALRQHIGELPPHISLIPADSPISTYSLFTKMDYCLTVRGTVGIEAAILGIPVLTAGTGRYDRRGFTYDSKTCEEFLVKVSHIQEIPRLSPAQQELAERFAYGIFVLRPLPLTTITFENIDTKTFNSEFRININAKEDWYNAQDLKAISRWLVNSTESDYLAPVKTA